MLILQKARSFKWFALIIHNYDCYLHGLQFILNLPLAKVDWKKEIVRIIITIDFTLVGSINTDEICPMLQNKNVCRSYV